jgi:putative ABC transport system substrate-binding protein
MHSGSNGNHDAQIQAFKDGLAWAGFTGARPGANVTIVGPLYADDNQKHLADNAAILVNTPVDVLVAAGGSASSQKAQAVTSTIPIVFTSVAEPARPAANMTGICARTSEFDADRLNLLHELLPGQKKFGVLVNPSRFNFTSQKGNLDQAAAKLGAQALDYKPVEPNGGNADALIGQAFQYWADNGYAGALVAADPIFNNHRNRVVATARAHSIPAIYQWREFAEVGGLMSYGPNLTVAYKLAGIYVGRILNNVAPKDQPVLSLNNFELVINLKTAKALALEVPPTLLARADHIIV